MKRPASTSKSDGPDSTRLSALRHLLGADPDPWSGRFYQTANIDLEPKPKGAARIPIWVGSWGSDIGLKRVAQLADGWLASAYNTDPQKFADGRRRLDELVVSSGRNVEPFPNAIATMFFHITDSRGEAPRHEIGGRLSQCRCSNHAGVARRR